MLTPELEALIDPYDYYRAMREGSVAEKVFHAARLKVVVEATPVAGKTVLELGCGTGMLAIPLARAGADVTGVELSQDHLDKMNSYAQEAGVAVEGIQADASDLPFEDDSFEVVVVASLVHLLPDPTAMLCEAERVCRPSGRLVICGPWQKHPKSNKKLKALLRGSAPDERSFPFKVATLRRLLQRSTYLGRKNNWAMGYYASLWSPDR